MRSRNSRYKVNSVVYERVHSGRWQHNRNYFHGPSESINNSRYNHNYYSQRECRYEQVNIEYNRKRPHPSSSSNMNSYYEKCQERESGRWKSWGSSTTQQQKIKLEGSQQHHETGESVSADAPPIIPVTPFQPSTILYPQPSKEASSNRNNIKQSRVVSLEAALSAVTNESSDSSVHKKRKMSTESLSDAHIHILKCKEKISAVSKEKKEARENVIRLKKELLEQVNRYNELHFVKISLGRKLKKLCEALVADDDNSGFSNNESDEEDLEIVNFSIDIPSDIDDDNKQKTQKSTVETVSSVLDGTTIEKQIEQVTEMLENSVNGSDTSNSVNLNTREYEPQEGTIVVSKLAGATVTDVKICNNRLFVGASHGILRQYDLKTHEIVMEYFGHRELIHCIQPISRTGIIKKQRLFSGGFDKQLMVHNIDSGTLLDTVKTDKALMALASNDDYVYYGTASGKVGAYSLTSDRVIGEFNVNDGVACLMSQKEYGQYLLFLGTNKGDMSIWDGVTLQQIKVVTIPSFVGAPIGFIGLPKQRVLVYTKSHVHFIKYKQDCKVSTISHLMNTHSFCMTQLYCIVGNNEGEIKLYRTYGSTIQKKVIILLKNCTTPIISLVFHNNTVISGDRSGRVYINRIINVK